MLCESGGSLDNKPGTKYGFQSRSLKAAYFLQQAGYNKVCIESRGGGRRLGWAGVTAVWQVLAPGSILPAAGRVHKGLC